MKKLFDLFRNYWAGFKKRWNIESDRQVVIILIAFTLTGTTTMYLHQLFNEWIGLADSGNFGLELLVFLLVVLPLYNGLLLIYGSLLGQYRFFSFFIVKFFKSIFRLFQLKGRGN